MKYQSTRDPQNKQLSFSDILLEGLAPDGGLYVPIEYPDLSTDLELLRPLNYCELATKILSLFVGDSIPKTDLQRIINETYSEDIFGSKDITPLTHLKQNIYIQDLSSGPSLAFKDMAMQFLGRIMDYELTRRNQQLVILGASSGDTVSAAEEAMKGKGTLKVVMLTPKTGMSPFQKAQAGSILDNNIYNISVQGPFDLCQDLVKEINNDAEFKERFHIGAVNSINWGRICAQIVYYFKGYFAVTKTNNQKIDVCVPSGNFGNVLAAYVAKRMGLPIRRLIVATNENIVLDTFFKTGIYKQRDVIVTSSPSMDISKASNIERLFFDLVQKNGETLKHHMQHFDKTKELDLSLYTDQLKHYGFSSGTSTHSERKQIIQDIFHSTKIILDPHTASAVKVALENQDDTETPIICMETAKPTKFEETIQEALGFIPERPVPYINLENKPQRFFDCEGNANAIKTFIAANLS